MNKRNDHQLKRLLIVEENSPWKHLRNCKENSMEIMSTDNRLQRVLNIFFSMDTQIAFVSCIFCK